LSSFESAETRIKKVTQTPETVHLDIDEKAMLLQQQQPTETRYYALGGALGTSRLTSHNAPAWKVNMLKGEIKETFINHTGSIRNEIIPQIQLELSTSVRPIIVDESKFKEYESLGDANLNQNIEDYNLQMFTEFEDGSSFQIENDTVVLEIQELHAPLGNLNFDIEVYEVEYDENNNEQLNLLKFHKTQIHMLKNDFVRKTQPSYSTVNPQENKKYNEYYMDIFFDAEVEIPRKSRSLRTLTSKTTPLPTIGEPIISNVPQNPFICPDDLVVFEDDQDVSDGGDEY